MTIASGTRAGGSWKKAGQVTLQGEDVVLAGAVDERLLTHSIDAVASWVVHEHLPAVVVSLARWICAAAEERDWRRVERLVNLGAVLQVPGLGKVVMDLLEEDRRDLNQEDLIEILGEVRAVEATELIFRVVKRSLGSDAPAYWLCQKAILSLAEMESADADRCLREMAEEPWPRLIRWHAAVMLGIEDDLGFDEDEALA